MNTAGWWIAAALVAATPRFDEFDAGLESIGEAAVEKHLEYLTSDVCAGRDTPQRGLLDACDYVAKHFQDAGLEPLGDDGTCLRRYPLACDDASAECALKLTGQEGDFAGTVREDFIPVRNSAPGAPAGDIVFVGYGIKDREYRWDDYKGVDVKGRIVVVLPLEPRVDGKEKKFFDGPEMTPASALREKARVAKEEGAIGMLVCPATAEEGRLWLSCQYPIYQDARAGGALDLPAAVISPALGDRLLGRSIAAFRDGIDRTRKADSFAVSGARAALKIQLDRPTLPVPNVVARYRGTDPARNGQVVVIGAHLDHVGVDDRGRIHRGADDNAGGVSAVLEVAEAFGRFKPQIGRSVVLVAFTGEEKGLLGSNAFAKDPPVPVGDIYAMINMDIIARGRKKAIEATLPQEKTLLATLLPTAVRKSRCRLAVGDGGNEFFKRSDHYEFHKVGVPTVFFNEGETNEDYHRWTDTADKALPDKIARVAMLAYTLACLAADSDLKGGLR